MRLVPLLFLLFAACGGDDAASTDAGVADAAHCNEPGTFKAQILAMGDGQEDRVYWLHVPPSTACSPMPLLVDFHGTATETPEEAYQTDSLIAASDHYGFIVARPRSRSSQEGTLTIFRWDQNPGDLTRNVTYAGNLVHALEARYAIDPARIYASGFSSGSNMVMQLGAPFRGVAAIAGGNWTTSDPPALPAGARVYLATGYRDYLWPFARSSARALVAAGYEVSFHRSGGGHDLYAWHWDELWRWLDAGQVAEPGAAMATWLEEPLPEPADVLAIAREGGQLVLAGAGGKTWTGVDGSWTLELDHGDTDYAALAFGEGGGVVGGEYKLARRLGEGWSSERTLPDFGGMLGQSWFAAAAAGASRLWVAGNWSASMSDDFGQTWTAFGVDGAWGGPAQVNGLAVGPDGTLVVAGYYDHVAVAGPGASSASSVEHPLTAEWWNAVAAGADGSFWVVGDGGAVMVSHDHGASWQAQDSGTDTDLYAVSMTAEGVGAAAGRDGVVIVTQDGGESWARADIGQAIFLGAVLVEGHTVRIAGQDGYVARLEL